MRFPLSLRDAPLRLITGAYIAHTGLEKWHGSAKLAEGLHRTASAAFPVLRPIRPPVFLKVLAASELAVASVILAPVVPNSVAGLALTGFSGALLAMYARTPTMHQPGSIWPSPTGIAVSKDVWLLAIGLSLVVSAAPGRHRTKEVATETGGAVRPGG